MQTTRWGKFLRCSTMLIVLLVIITGRSPVGATSSSCDIELPDGTEKCEVSCDTGEKAVCGRNEAQVWCYCEEK